jgi:uncharacterized membrane protein YdbT with pleckstrin-like domain
MEKKFDDIIEKDEQIIKVYKPNKRKYAWSLALSLFFLLLFTCLPILLGIIGVVEHNGAVAGIAVLVIAIIGVLLILITVLLAVLYYKNKYYCYTDTRVIIRSGIFGIDYSSLEFRSLTATLVNVSLLDKILGGKTGTITFGSASSQITGGGQNGKLNPYVFRHIEKPYEVMKEIKEYIKAKQS